MTILYGGDYNPEQWPEDTWQDDWDKLKLAKVNSATINVFSWALLEPREGQFSFDKLDRIVKLLEDNNIKIVMATSTGALPNWMTRKYPEVTRVDTYGIRQIGGKRENACPNSPMFQHLSNELVEKIAKRYSNVKNITHWHISNEYGGYCYCDNCAVAFRKWLKKEYNNDLNEVNTAWGTNVWSHTYNSWNEINPPMKIGDVSEDGKPVLSGLDLAYRRFQSDSLLNNFKKERDIIRKYDDRPITTNLMGTQKDLDYFKWAKEMDIVSWDNYPAFDTPAGLTAMEHDLMRGLKQKPFMLMEQTPNQTNWQVINRLKAPNQMRMYSYQAMAHGADTIQFFQLKQARNGSEKFHSALISHSNSTDTRTFKELEQLGNELQSLPTDIVDSTNNSEVGIIFDWNNYWGLEDATGPIKQDYVQQVYDYYKEFYDRHIGVDMISKETDFKKYKLIIAPNMYINSESLTKRIEYYVSDGGVFVTNYMSGIVDKDDNVSLGGYPGLLRKVMGIKIDETDALPDDVQNQLIFKDKNIGSGSLLCDLIQPDTATSLAHYGKNVFYTDYSALTKNEFGKGTAYYAGSRLDKTAINYFLTDILQRTQIKSDSNNIGVEMIQRESSNNKFEFIINTDSKEKVINNPYPQTNDLLTHQQIGEEIHLSGYDVLILQIKK